MQRPKLDTAKLNFAFWISASSNVISKFIVFQVGYPPKTRSQFVRDILGTFAHDAEAAETAANICGRLQRDAKSVA